MPSVKAVLRKEPNRAGEHALMLQVIIGRKIKKYSLKQFVKKEYWNPFTQKVKPREGRALHLNHLITKRVKEVQDVFHRFEMEGRPLTLEAFAQTWKGGGSNRDFYGFFEQEYRSREGRYAPNTRRNHESMCLKLRKFSPTLYLSSIDYEFMTRFEEYLLDKQRGNISKNTANSYMRILRTYLNIAHRKGHITNLSFQQYSPPAFVSNRDWLTEVQIKELIELNLEKRTEKAVRDMFVFACCTGLRYSDLKELRWENIQDNLLILTNQKTGRKIAIPLIQMAKEILEKQPRQEGQPIFKPLTNAHYNAVLGSIAEKAKITTPLTSHIARHTFATLALTKGIAVEVVSSLLGHTSIRTTQVYAKVIDARKIEEMQKFKIGEEKAEYGGIASLS